MELSNISKTFLSFQIGVRFYPSGYRPEETSHIENMKAYMNIKGIFFHLSRNLKVDGGIIADNREGIEIDRSDNIDLQGTTIIGISTNYRRLQAAQKVLKVCRQGTLTGLEHHTWKNDLTVDGSSIKNLTFSGFLETGCEIGAAAIRVDDRVSACSLFPHYLTKVISLISYIYFDVLCGFRFRYPCLIFIQHFSSFNLRRVLKR